MSLNSFNFDYAYQREVYTPPSDVQKEAEQNKAADFWRLLTGSFSEPKPISKKVRPLQNIAAVGPIAEKIGGLMAGNEMTQQAAKLLEGASNVADYVPETAKALAGLGSRLSDFVTKMLPFLADVKEGESRAKIIKVLVEKDRHTMGEVLSSSFLQRVKNDKEKANLIQALSDLYGFEDTHPLAGNKELSTFILTRDEPERDALFAFLEKFETEEANKLFPALQKLDGQQRREILQAPWLIDLDFSKTLNMLNNLADPSNLMQDLAALMQVPASPKGFLEVSLSNDAKGKLSFWLACMTQNDRISLVAKLSPLLSNVPNNHDKLQMFTVLAGHSAEEINTFSSWLEGVDPLDKKELISFASKVFLVGIDKDFSDKFASLTPKGKINFISFFTPILESKEPQAIPAIVRLLEEYGKIPPDQWDSFTALASSFKNYTFEDMIMIIRRARFMPVNERQEILELARPIFEASDSIDREYFGDVLEDIRNRTPMLRKSLREEISRGTQAINRYLDGVFGRKSIEVIEIELRRTDLGAKPVQLLEELCKSFKNQPAARKLKVTFSGELGLDAGGIGRQFISELFEEIRKSMGFEMLESGLYRPRLKSGNYTFSEEHKRIYHQLGELMMFCMNAEEDYPIGMVFDHSVFDAIVRITDVQMNLNIEQLSFKDLFPLYVAMQPKDGAVLKMTRYLNPQDDRDFLEAFIMVEAEEEIQQLGIGNYSSNMPAAELRRHSFEIQNALEKYIVRENIRPILVPLIEMLRGMKEATLQSPLGYSELRSMEPSKLLEKLQGTITRELILQKLTFENVPENRQKWIENWIMLADDEKIKKFLFTLTGSCALGNKPLEIVGVSGPGHEACFFHTCANTVDIPLETVNSEEMMFWVMDAALPGSKAFTNE